MTKAKRKAKRTRQQAKAKQTTRPSTQTTQAKTVEPLSERDRQWVPIPLQRISGSFDVAQNTNLNEKHWGNADALSPDAALVPWVRKRIAHRARYEVGNNSYAAGIVQTLTNSVIGTGPRVQAGRRTDLESAWRRQAQTMGLTAILQQLFSGMVVSGESFGLLVRNPTLGAPTELDLQAVESEVVAGEYTYTDQDDCDGIILGQDGRPREYRVLRAHPGSGSYEAQTADMFKADAVCHLYRGDRPGQHRGLSLLAPALPLFAQLRRFTLAVLSAAETAANFAAVIYTESPPSGEADDVNPLDLIELERNIAMTLPAGWKIGQVAAQQPSTTYDMFKAEILNEIARCVNMPYNIAAGNSSDYNYASGRLDHQVYYQAVRIMQDLVERVVLWPLWQGFCREYLGTAEVPEPRWYWDAPGHVDPLKEANAQAKRLESGTSSMEIELGKEGLDWQDVMVQQQREQQMREELGLPAPSWQSGTSGGGEQPQEDDE